MKPVEPELSMPIRLDRLGATPMTVNLTPDSAVRAALAKRFDLRSLDAFTAELSIHRQGGTGWIEVAGTIEATVVQTCVVTGEPVAATVSAGMHELFDDSGEIDPAEIDLDPMAETPEPIVGDALDVGEIAAQTLGLSLDPYPRAPGATVPETDLAGGGASPFASLAALATSRVKKE